MEKACFLCRFCFNHYSELFKLRFFQAEYNLLPPRIRPIMVGCSHDDSSPVHTAGSISYFQTSLRNRDNDNKSLRVKQLGRVLHYDMKLQDRLNGGKDIESVLTHEDMEWRVCFEETHWCVFRCNAQLNRDYSEHWEPRCLS